MSKKYTNDEVRAKFLSHVNHLVKYWAEQPNQTDFEKVEGVAFSILSVIDGCSMNLPGFVLAPQPHKDDKQFHIGNDEDYYPRTKKVKTDIAGTLHERLKDYK
jgi:hypothetical protein